MVESMVRSVSLSSLMHGIELSSPCPDLIISGLASDSRDVQQGYIFFALQGSRQNGIDFIAEASSRGAAAIVVDSRDYAAIQGATNVIPTKVPILVIEGLVFCVSKEIVFC